MYWAERFHEETQVRLYTTCDKESVTYLLPLALERLSNYASYTDTVIPGDGVRDRCGDCRWGVGQSLGRCMWLINAELEEDVVGGSHSYSKKQAKIGRVEYGFRPSRAAKWRTVVWNRTEWQSVRTTAVPLPWLGVFSWASCPATSVILTAGGGGRSWRLGQGWELPKLC